ncbi:MAG: hypothetical protein OEW12_05335 [Deltaproteobacteria bacterium]|nr:hypothetical protein [Deltaproteobacteria bacterium]
MKNGKVTVWVLFAAVALMVLWMRMPIGQTPPPPPSGQTPAP